jgi:aryl-alcohol dehydrogenase-like predicted oxidoreductase
MQKRRIGSLDVTLVGLGCNNFGWRIDAAATQAVVDAAIAAGINFFDTADIYGGGKSEEFLGQALGQKRSSVLVATKFGLPLDETRKGARPAYVKRAAEDSLKRLGTDVIDLYQLHKPDPETPIADTLAAMDELVKAGKVREIGCSNFSAEQIEEAAGAVKAGAAKFVSVQNHYSMIQREAEAEVLPECQKSKLAFLPYFPLENGLLTGKYRAGNPMPKGSRGADEFGPKVFTDQNLALAEALAQFAESKGHTLLELAFSWLAAKPVVASVIAGAKTPEQVKANSEAMSWTLSPDELKQVNKILGQAG